MRRRSGFWRWVGRLFLLGFIAAIAFLGWSVGIEPGMLVTREREIAVRGWPAELNEYKVVFLTDLHVGSPHIGLDKVREIVAETNARQPDLILLGGDFLIDGVLGGGYVPPGEIAPILTGLTAKDGVYAVLGNHDNWNDGPGMRAALVAQGITVLDDQSVRIGDGEASFHLAGITDFDTAPHNIAKALEGTTAPTIVLTHNPDVFPQIPDSVALTLAGHTHGGQVWVPFRGRPVVPSIYGQRYVMGTVREGQKTLFVRSGIGTSIWPIRFMTPPEIVVMCLVEPSISLNKPCGFES